MHLFVSVGHVSIQETTSSDGYGAFNVRDNMSIPEACDILVSLDRRCWFKILKRPLISAVDLLVQS